ncbi:MAG: HIT domain-containing protein, partial [Leptospiraceae bacterium]|nr:HIT domain-containing protein [Leptospiraceae bacterium]
ISKFARDKGFSEKGYRVVNNMGRNGGQTVFHIHFHLLAERRFTWPPG